MNVIRVMGGLGNQLFQYAFGKAQMKNGIEVRFIFPTRAEQERHWQKKRKWLQERYKQWVRFYCLDKFELVIKEGHHLPVPTIYEHNPECGFDMGLLKRDNCNFEGYWQYLGYFKDFLPELRKEFTVKEAFHTPEFLRLKELILNDPDSVGVHVRRGDYVLQKGFHDLPLSFYLKALTYTKGNIYICSDDLPWCREKFKEEYFERKVTFLGLENYLDFQLMRYCKHIVLPNSSFSYWVGVLNDNPDAIIVSPDRWLGDPEPDTTELHYPKEWIKLKS